MLSKTLCIERTLTSWTLTIAKDENLIASLYSIFPGLTLLGFLVLDILALLQRTKKVLGFSPIDRTQPDPALHETYMSLTGNLLLKTLCIERTATLQCTCLQNN